MYAECVESLLMRRGIFFISRLVWAETLSCLWAPTLVHFARRLLQCPCGKVVYTECVQSLLRLSRYCFFSPSCRSIGPRTFRNERQVPQGREEGAISGCVENGTQRDDDNR